MCRCKPLVYKIILGVTLVVLAAAIIAVVIVLKDEYDGNGLKDEYDGDGGGHRVATTSCGKVQGKRFEFNNDTDNKKTIYEFRNIPYAVPPLANRRWKPPTLLQDSPEHFWSGELKYSNKTVLCSQRRQGVSTITGQEDCLVLDIRTPNTDSNTKLPVVVWIHGGGLLWGEKDLAGYNPDAEYTSSLNAVTVSINYRLNIFGFLSLKELWIESGSERSYGNYGIMDMIAALKWVNKEIHNFGGDNNNIIIYGHSGGGNAAYSLLASESAKGLFNKLISGSGVPTVRINHNQADVLYRTYISATNCTRNTQLKIRKCLEGLPVETLLEFAPWFIPTVPGVPSILTNLLSYQVFIPENKRLLGFPIEILDGVIIQQSPNEMNSSGINTKIDVLFTNVAEELPAFVNVSTMQQLEFYMKSKVETFGNASYQELLTLYTANDTKEFQPDILTPRYLYSVIGSDWLSGICATNDFTKQLALSSDYNAYRLVVSQQPELLPHKLTRGSYHGWEIRALFNFNEPGYIPGTNEDLKLLMNIRQVIKQFVHGEIDHAYRGKTMVLWNNTINVINREYHEKQCVYLRKHGFLTHSAGNLGV